MTSIDGSLGEGGGQILRTSLALSMITGQPFEMHSIRKRRAKPGLMRQHLTCVRAAREICNATTKGEELKSEQLKFQPQKVQPGSYDFQIGTAGSASLVFQTVMPALLLAKGNSELSITGGTHNPQSPSFDFIARAFVPMLQRLGARMHVELQAYGFVPAGGGRFTSTIEGGALASLSLEQPGRHKAVRVTALSSAVPSDVNERELAIVGTQLRHLRPQLRARQVDSIGPGNVLTVELECTHRTAVLVEFGARRLSAERVAHKLAARVLAFIETQAVADEYLADQLLLPLALAGGGSFTAASLSEHFTTNSKVIGRFLPIEVTTQRRGDSYLVHVSRAR